MSYIEERNMILRDLAERVVGPIVAELREIREDLTGPPPTESEVRVRADGIAELVLIFRVSPGSEETLTAPVDAMKDFLLRRG